MEASQSWRQVSIDLGISDKTNTYSCVNNKARKYVSTSLRSRDIAQSITMYNRPTACYGMETSVVTADKDVHEGNLKQRNKMKF